MVPSAPARNPGPWVRATDFKFSVCLIDFLNSFEGAKK